MTITRFAPSPTGLLHLGNLRTAIFNALIARRKGGTFILRIDDTDPERSEERYVDAIRRDLDWLGIDWDREERQSARMALYRAAADELREAGRLYPCWETPEELALKRKKQLQMKRPPVYDRSALRLSDDEKGRLMAVPWPDLPARSIEPPICTAPVASQVTGPRVAVWRVNVTPPAMNTVVKL